MVRVFAVSLLASLLCGIATRGGAPTYSHLNVGVVDLPDQ